MYRSRVKAYVYSFGKPIASFFILFSFLCFGSVMYWKQINDASSILETETLKQTTVRAKQVNSSITVAVSILFRDIDHYTKELIEAFDSKKTALLNAKIEEIKANMPNNSVLQVAIIDAQGYLTYSNLGFSERVYLGDRKHFKVHTESSDDKLYISEPIFGRVSKEWSIQFTRSIRENGEFKGVLVFSLSVKYLQKILEDIALSNNDSLSILKETGEYLVRNLDNEKAMGKALAKERPYTKKDAPVQGEFRDVSGFDGVARLYVWHHIHDYPIIVVLGLSENNALDPIRDKIDEDKSNAIMGLTIFWGFILILTILGIRLIKMREMRVLKDILEKENEELDRRVKEEVLIQNQYKEAIDKILIVSITDPQGIITYVNDNFVRISGYSREELLGKNHNIIRHPNTPSAFFKELWATLQLKQQWKGSFANRRKNGSTYYVQASIFPLLDTDGNIKEYIAIREDISEQVLAKRRVTTILDNQESIVVLIDEAHGMIEANKKFFETFAFANLEAFQSKHTCVQELFIEKEGYLSASFRGENGEIWTKVLLNEPEKTYLALMEDKHKHEKIFNIKISQIELENTGIYLATFMDITALELARIAAAEAEKAKALFLANMSHEIRTPMNGIMGFLQILELTTLDEKQKKYIELMNVSTNTLLEIINKILDFSKIESGQVECEYIKINPFTEFEHIFQILSEKARQKDISYLTVIDPTINECLFIDVFHIKQVMLNLISNAIKFTHEHGTVRVELKRRLSKNGAMAIEFSVADSGIGIPHDRLEKIFLPFAQADSSTTRRFGGTGLGLSICNSLVKLMGSELKVESEEGVGSRFFFELNVKACSPMNSIATHVSQYAFCILDTRVEQLPSITSYLDHFGISYELCSVLPEKVGPQTVLITTDPDMALQSAPQCRVILILDASNAFTRSHANITVVPSFDECPSSIYNALLSLEMITQENDVSNEGQYGRLSALVADDYELNRTLMGELLGRYGVKYTFATNGEEALLELTKQQFDIIFMDVNMPVLNGVDATKKIREEGITTPIVAFTANALEKDRELYLKSGMQHVLTKPIQLPELEAILNQYHV